MSEVARLLMQALQLREQARVLGCAAIVQLHDCPPELLARAAELGKRTKAGDQDVVVICGGVLTLSGESEDDPARTTVSMAKLERSADE